MDFFERRDNYYNKMRQHPEVLTEMLKRFEKEDKYDSSEIIEAKRVIFHPADEEELEFDVALCDALINIKALTDSLPSEIRSINIEDNYGLSYYINIVNAVKNNDNVNEVMKEELTPELIAKILYSFIVATVVDSEGTFEYVANKIGLNLENDFDREQLIVYTEEAFKIINVPDFSFSGDTEKKQMELESVIKFTKEFNKLYEEGRIPEEEIDKNKHFAEVLTRSIMNAFKEVEKCRINSDSESEELTNLKR